jgi:hypothetical protein
VVAAGRTLVIGARISRQGVHQDVFNMPKVQAGLESTYQTGIVLSGYQESKVR